MLKGYSPSSQGGSSWSSPLRSDGSRDDQVGEAGPVEPQLSGGRESQRVCPTTTPMRKQSQPDGRAVTKQWQKAALHRKIPLVRKSYSLYLRVKLQKGADKVGEDDDE